MRLNSLCQGLNNSLDPDTSLELENLRLEHLKLQEAQVLCKHRMLLLKQAEKKSVSTFNVMPAVTVPILSQFNKGLLLVVFLFS